MEPQNPTPESIPVGAIRHGACGKWWTGAERSHCGACHELFSGLSAFERHRRGMRCNPPHEIGLVPREKPYGIVWGTPAPENGFGFDFADRSGSPENAA